MNKISDTTDRISTALERAGFRVLTPERAGQLTPPGVVISFPTLTWGDYSSEPSALTYQIAAVVANGERVSVRLYEHLQAVVDALEAIPDVAVTTATAGSYPAGGTELPAYQITTEVAP